MLPIKKGCYSLNKPQSRGPDPYLGYVSKCITNPESNWIEYLIKSK